VVRPWSTCRSTRAAATIFPIRHGSRLTLRSARKVIFSKEFPRSRYPDTTVDLVELPLQPGQLAALGAS
jgi:hypothetical protein